MAIGERSRQSRRWLIGSSDVPAILGCGYESAYDLFLRKREMATRKTESEAMELGAMLEPMLLDWAAERLSHNEMSRDFEAVSPHYPYMVANLDALLWVGRGEDCGLENVEVKTTGIGGWVNRKEWGDDGSEDVPDRVMAQVQFQMYCAGPRCKISRVVALIGGVGRRIYNVERSDEFISRMLPYLERFYDDLVEGNYPEARPSLDVIKQIGRQSREVPAAEKLLDLYEKASENSRRWKKIRDARLADILGAMGVADTAVFPSGRKLIFRQISRAGYTVQPTVFRQAIIKEAPDDPSESPRK